MADRVRAQSGVVDITGLRGGEHNNVLLYLELLHEELEASHSGCDIIRPDSHKHKELSLCLSVYASLALCHNTEAR